MNEENVSQDLAGADDGLIDTAKTGEQPKLQQKADGTRRKIQGNLPYTGSPGPLAKVLEKIVVSEKPDVFSPTFMETVLGVSGGASRPVIPILKATQLLNQSGNPTELYSQFQTEGGRSLAALEALKRGYLEIFRRNQFAHLATDETVKDLIVAVTGLPKSENIVRYIFNTFSVFQRYAKNATESGKGKFDLPDESSELQQNHISDGSQKNMSSLGLVYNINIVLPETTNIEVYNAIFKSLRGNML